jgi:hypothetical protein
MELRKFWDTKPYSVIHEYDVKESKNLFRFKMLRPIPQSAWELIIGDSVHNARSALDYIAWRLAGSDLADIHTQFPICLTSDKFDKLRWRLKRIPRDALTEILKLQPYTQPNPEASALWLLQELDARDKHKLITAVEYVTESSGISVEDPVPVTIPHRALSKLEDNTVVAEIPGPPNPEVKMEIEFSFGILFEWGIVSSTDDYGVRDCLCKIFDAVEIVIKRFEWLLRTNPRWINERNKL